MATAIFIGLLCVSVAINGNKLDVDVLSGVKVITLFFVAYDILQAFLSFK